MSRDAQIAYLSSTDGGLSWNIKYSEAKMNACTYIEKAGVYLASCEGYNNNKYIEKDLYIYRSTIGPDDTDPEVIMVAEGGYYDAFLPQQSFFTDRVWFTAQEKGIPSFFYSDDFGKTWTERKITAMPVFEPVFPHKGLRWSVGSGSEPYVVELSRDKMVMILRTPTDNFYKSYSYDGGDSWTEPEESTFYGTNTTAFMLRLTDGRVITFWNNTKPLPQPNHNLTFPPVTRGVMEGLGENAFTNRDVAHAAITDDGENFIGYREILLNEIRNNSDFRYIGGAVWNFPASKQGKVTVNLKIVEKQARIALSDRWYNTCDPYAAVQSPFWFEIDAADIGAEFVAINIDFDTDKGEAKVFIGEELFFKVKMTNPCPTGISYLILQCATDGDSKGFYVKELIKE